MPKTSKRKRAPAADWRTPLFYWRGLVSESGWSGAWVASADGLPAAGEFETSPTKFTLSWAGGALAAAGDAAAGEWSGHYLLDNGDGLAEYSDTLHKAATAQPARESAADDDEAAEPAAGAERAGGWAVVGARGGTEFGEFVSLGRLDSDGTLTLARRYITDQDPRCKLSAEEVVARVAAGGPDARFGEAPWEGLPWQVPEQWPAPLP